MQTIDMEAALDEIGGDEELLCEIAEIFLEDYRDLQRRMRRAACEADREALYSVVHSIKGSAASFRANNAVHCAQAIERLCRAGDLTGAPRHVESLIAAVDELAMVLRARFGRRV